MIGLATALGMAIAKRFKKRKESLTDEPKVGLIGRFLQSIEPKQEEEGDPMHKWCKKAFPLDPSNTLEVYTAICGDIQDEEYPLDTLQHAIETDDVHGYKSYYDQNQELYHRGLRKKKADTKPMYKKTIGDVVDEVLGDDDPQEGEKKFRIKRYKKDKKRADELDSHVKTIKSSGTRLSQFKKEHPDLTYVPYVPPTEEKNYSSPKWNTVSPEDKHFLLND